MMPIPIYSVNVDGRKVFREEPIYFDPPDAQCENHPQLSQQQQQQQHVVVERKNRRVPCFMWFLAVLLLMVTVLLILCIVLLIFNRKYKTAQSPIQRQSFNDDDEQQQQTAWDLFVTPQFVMTALVTKQNICLLDTTGGGNRRPNRTLFNREHIKGAYLFDFGNVTSVKGWSRRFPVHPIDFQSYIRSLHVNSDCHVILYQTDTLNVPFEIKWTTYA